MAPSVIKHAVTPYYYLYHSLIFLALLLSIIAYFRGNKKLIFLVLILLLAFIVELLTGIFKFYKIKGAAWMYHAYNLAEYPLFCLYYLKAIQTFVFRWWIILSVPVYILLCLSFSYFIYHFQSLPAYNIDLEGFLLFIIYTHLLFNLNLPKRMFIHAHPDFWIVIGVLIFYGGTFVFFGLYPKLIHLDHVKTIQLYGMIAGPLNIILYTCLITGFLCSIRNRKFSAA